MTRQRLYGILAGYEDCNDHDTLRSEPVFKLVAGRPIDDDPLASQPTLSRFENSVTCAELQRLIDFVIDTGVERLREKHHGELPDQVTLDLDTTDDPTHGHQQLTLFHGYYDQYQYLPLMDKAIRRYERTGVKQRLFMRFEYQAESWPHPRQVVAKAECHAGGTNLRFVVRSRPTPGVRQARRVYDDYIQRGTSEQRMDELKNGLCADRLSCHRFVANFLRLLLHTAAYNLLNALRDHADVPAVLRKGPPCTWRTHLIKVAATVKQTCRRIVVKLAGQWPWVHFYTAVSQRALLGGRAP
jgi:hypothetical protein